MTSSHATTQTSVSSIMLKVGAALLPGIFVYVYIFGFAILINLFLASLTALAAEALMLRLRAYPIKPFLLDGSALVTALLLALSLPPLAPWWLIVLGTAFAIIVAKHLYGGLGNNLFNPAMVGFAVLMVSFPAQMTHWPAPLSLASAHLDLSDALQYVWNGSLPAGLQVDAINMATPLDTLKTQLHQHLPVAEIMKMPVFDLRTGNSSAWVSLMYLLGGLYLLRARVITWHIPTAFLGSLFVVASLFYFSDAAHYAAPWFHLLSGGTLLCAFFIATDPVTGATTPRGKLLFGCGIGILTYVIRVLGGYPDGVAFAVLLMNAFVPLIDAYTQPRVFGHAEKSKK